MSEVTWVTEARFDDWAAEAIVGDDGIISNVALSGNRSKNGYDIPPAAFGSEQECQALYNGKPVFTDHQPRDKRDSPFERSITDFAGEIHNVRLRNGRPFGDIRTEGAPQGQLLRDAAVAKFSHMGMSHVAAYEFNPANTAVERIKEIATVDAVVFPATTRTFSEQVSGKENGEPPMSDNSSAAADRLVDKFQQENTALTGKNTTLSTKLDEANKTITAHAEQTETLTAEKESLAQESKTTFDEAKVKWDEEKAGLEKERDELKTKVEQFEVKAALAARGVKIAEQLQGHKLKIDDTVVCSESFMKTLMDVEDDTEREALIKDRAALVAEQAKKSGKNELGSTERHENGGDDKEFDVEKVDTSDWLTDR